MARIYESSNLGRLQPESVNGGLGQLQISESASVNDIQKIRSACEAKGGFLTILNAPLEIKQNLEVWGFQGNGEIWMRSIRQQFDPLNLLSPGRIEA